MYAVIKTGGKQYKVAVGEKLKVEQIPAELDSQKRQGHRQNFTQIEIVAIA